MPGIEELSELIAEELRVYSHEVQENVKAAVKATTRELVERTKADAPEKSGNYKKAISSKVIKSKGGEYAELWYVKPPSHRLAHLLNNGHAKRGGGRVAGDGHITVNEEKAMNDFEARVQEAIANGH